MLTPEQLTTLKNYIATIPEWQALSNTNVGNSVIAGALNATASPNFIVWKTEASIADTTKAFNGTEWAGMTSANHTRLQTVRQWLADSYDASRADIRAMFNDIWSGAGGTNTRAALLVVWKRKAKLIEKILATGTGSDGSPATLGFEGTVSPDEIEQARAL